MTEAYKNTIEVLQAELAEKEKDVRDTKRLINSLCKKAGIQALHADADEVTPASLTSLRRDQFYGVPLASAIRAFLEMRRSAGLGPATVSEIYEALSRGGYKFDAKNGDNAKRGLYISLGKNTSVFHKLPGATDETAVFGLLSWYPAAKAPKSPATTKNARIAEAHGENELDEL